MLDASIDWTQYDNDGDGYVDLVVFLQPAQDGACGGPGNNHLWSHRFSFGSGYGPEFTTHSPAAGGGFIKVRDYLLQSALGGATACDAAQIMPIGTVAHETGHGFGLPDLYDTQTSSEGIGDWGLMGAGNYTSALSPSRMEAWSLNELGWVTVAPLTVGGSYQFNAAPVADTAFYIRARGNNPRGEYFLLENRQASQSDTAMIRFRCQRSSAPASCPGGLLIWHIDSLKVANGSFGNSVNSGAIHGVALMQADGLRDLDFGQNRGDAGDAYPGIARPSTPSPRNPNVEFSVTSTPAARKNLDSSSVGFALDSIRQLVPGALMRFRLRFGQPLVFTATAHGTVTPNPVSATSGSFIAESSTVTLTAATDPGYIFAGWTGDTSTINTDLVLTMVAALYGDGELRHGPQRHERRYAAGCVDGNGISGHPARERRDRRLHVAARGSGAAGTRTVRERRHHGDSLAGRDLFAAGAGDVGRPAADAHVYGDHHGPDVGDGRCAGEAADGHGPADGGARHVPRPDRQPQRGSRRGRFRGVGEPDGRPGAAGTAMKRVLLAVLIALSGACEHNTAPVAGLLRVQLTTPNSGGDRAILVSVSGPAALTSIAAPSALRVFSYPPFGTTNKFVVTGTIPSGTILTIGVADVGQAGSYTATVQQAATPTYQLRDLDGLLPYRRAVALRDPPRNAAAFRVTSVVSAA